MKKPLILMTGNRSNYPNYPVWRLYSNTEDCYNAIEDAGGLPVMPSYYRIDQNIHQLVERVDGIFVTGGDDVDPSAYGEETLPVCGATCPDRDQFEIAVIKAAMALDKPIFCVCRGSQMLNVALGGTLYQDLPSQRPSDIAHLQNGGFDQPSHPARIVEKDSVLYRALGQDEIWINSTHHQAVKDLAPGLTLVAQAPDGVVEATQYKGKRFVVALQWHPEMLLEDPQRQALFTAFIDACRG